MKKLKRVLRLFLLILLIVLASLGMGISGAAPVLPKSRGKNADEEVKIEVQEPKKSKKKHLAKWRT